MVFGKQGRIARHWRGEYALARSFWLHYLLVPIAILFAIFTLEAIVGTSSSYGGYLGGASMLLLIGAYIWGLVGTWRSAKNAPGVVGKKLVLFFLGAQVVAVGGFLLLYFLYMLLFLIAGGSPH